jgi:hypothetical protein
MLTQTISLSNNQSITPSTETISVNVSGSNNITFAFDNLDQSVSTINKIIGVCFDGEEYVVNRSLSTTDLSSISAFSVSKIFETTFLDFDIKDILFLLQRDDGIVDRYTISVSVYNNSLADYTKIDLIKTDACKTKDNDNSILLTLGTRGQELFGLNMISNKITSNFYSTSATSTSSSSISVTFLSEYEIVNPNISHKKIPVMKYGNSNGPVTLTYATRVPAIDNIQIIEFNGAQYVNAIPNSTFMHVSGDISWDCNDDLNKLISVPIIDLRGADTSIDPASIYIDLYNNTGVGTVGSGSDNTTLTAVSGNYFFVDLLNVSSCDNLTSEITTVSVFINY